MRITLSTLALAGLLIVGSGAAIAQDNATATPQQPQAWGHHGMNADERLNHLTKTLDLTSDQQAQIKPILENEQQQAMQIHQDQSLAQQDRHGKMQSLRQDTNSKIEAVLNDTQKQKFEEMQAKMRQHMQEHMQNGSTTAPQQQ